MLNKYLESRSWIARNPSKMDEEIRDRFDALLVKFDAWVATLEPDDRDAVESHIKAFELVMRVFPEAKINKDKRNEVVFLREKKVTYQADVH